MANPRVVELQQRLREAHTLHDPCARMAVELVKLTVEDLKDSLVGADGDDMLRLQGAVRVFRKLYNELTTTPPNIRPPEENNG